MVRVKRGEMQGKSSRDKAPVAAGIPENERGMALVLALVMLVLLTILGAWAIGTASTDLTIAGNFRNTQNAFYSADAALAYAANPDTLTTAYLYTVANRQHCGMVTGDLDRHRYRQYKGQLPG